MLADSLLLVVTFFLVMSFFFGSSDGLTLLGRKSTADQVYRYLNQNNQLAPYVVSGTAVVTGGNSGIGVETVKTLVDAGMTVVLCARNVESANQVKDNLPETKQKFVDVQYMDLSNLTSVKEAADSIMAKYKSIDCLINNAGIMALPKREVSTDGIEMQWGTNHVGHHLLTRLLLPQINSETGRIVTVASTAHTMAKRPVDDWESKESYSPWGTYGKSKLSNILFATQLQKELKANSNGGGGICSVSLHPGVIKSPLWKHTLPSLLQPVVSLIANKNIEQGAATTIYCALCRSVQGGAYYDDCAVKEPSAFAKDVKLQQGLWDYTESLLAEKGFELPKLAKTATGTAPAEVAAS